MENLDRPGVMANLERRYEMAGLGDSKINPHGNNENGTIETSSHLFLYT